MGGRQLSAPAPLFGPASTIAVIPRRHGCPASGIAAIVGPAIFPLSFAFALRSWPALPGLPILIAAGLLALGLLFAVRSARPVRPA